MVAKHSSWDWIKEKDRWNQIREQDKRFLEEFGFNLFNDLGVNYVNVTGEVWRGWTADAGEIKEEVRLGSIRS